MGGDHGWGDTSYSGYPVVKPPGCVAKARITISNDPASVH